MMQSLMDVKVKGKRSGLQCCVIWSLSDMENHNDHGSNRKRKNDSFKSNILFQSPRITPISIMAISRTPHFPDNKIKA